MMETFSHYILKILSKSTFISLFFLTSCSYVVPGLIIVLDDILDEETEELVKEYEEKHTK